MKNKLFFSLIITFIALGFFLGSCNNPADLLDNEMDDSVTRVKNCWNESADVECVRQGQTIGLMYNYSLGRLEWTAFDYGGTTVSYVYYHNGISWEQIARIVGTGLMWKWFRSGYRFKVITAGCGPYAGCYKNECWLMTED